MHAASALLHISDRMLHLGTALQLHSDSSLCAEMQQHLSDVRQQFTELPQRLSEVPQRLSEAPQQLSDLRYHLTTFIRHHMTAPNLLIMAAVVAGLLLVVLLLRNMLQKQVCMLVLLYLQDMPWVVFMRCQVLPVSLYATCMCIAL